MLLTVVFLVKLCFGQNIKKGILLNSIDGSKIPFATVKLLNSNTGTFSNESGEFEVAGNLYDSLRITSIGYSPKIIIIKTFLSDTILMNPSTVALPNILVKKRILLSNETVGVINEKSDFLWGPSGFGEEFAQKITVEKKHEQEQFKLLKVILLAKKFSPKYPVILHIYSKDDITGLPGMELLQSTYFISNKNFKHNKIIIDLSQENLFISETEFFIGFEWLGKTSENNNSGTGTLLQMTSTIKDSFTFSRTLAHKTYYWFPAPSLPNKTGPANTMFSIEIERYK